MSEGLASLSGSGQAGQGRVGIGGGGAGLWSGLTELRFSGLTLVLRGSGWVRPNRPLTLGEELQIVFIGFVVIRLGWDFLVGWHLVVHVFSFYFKPYLSEVRVREIRGLFARYGLCAVAENEFFSIWIL